MHLIKKMYAQLRSYYLRLVLPSSVDSDPPESTESYTITGNPRDQQLLNIIQINNYYFLNIVKPAFIGVAGCFLLIASRITKRTRGMKSSNPSTH